MMDEEEVDGNPVTPEGFTREVLSRGWAGVEADKLGTRKIEEEDKIIIKNLDGEEWISQSDLADKTNMSTRSLRDRMKKLLSMGYIETRKSPDDARIQQYRVVNE